jgi:hypothetical protein
MLEEVSLELPSSNVLRKTINLNIKGCEIVTRPGISSGSDICPTLTSIAAAALSASGSEMSKTLSPFVRASPR